MDVDVLADPEVDRHLKAAIQILVDHELEASAA
jgi:hypothetical protein